MTIPIRVINLQRSPDRRATIIAHLEKLGLAADFFDAVDGYKMTATEIAEMRPGNNPASPLMPGQIGIAASYRNLCREIATGQAPFVCILEDDCLLAPKAVKILHADYLASLAPFDVLRLGHAGMRWSLGVTVAEDDGFAIVAPLFPQGLTHAQVVSRAGAARIADGTVPLLTPIDIQLFNDAVALGLRTLHVVPRLAEISASPSTIATDAEAGRVGAPVRTRWVRNIASFAKAWGLLAILRVRHSRFQGI